LFTGNHATPFLRSANPWGPTGLSSFRVPWQRKGAISRKCINFRAYVD
jgi:hypothetical protein